MKFLQLLLLLLLVFSTSSCSNNKDQVSKIQDIDCLPAEPCYGIDRTTLTSNSLSAKSLNSVFSADDTESSLSLSESPTSKPPKTIDVIEATGFTLGELSILEESLSLAERVTQSSCYRDFFLNRELIQTNGKTRGEVVEDLTTKTVSINLKMYFKNNSTVGYTYANSDTIFLNRKFHKGFNLCQSAGNLKHEGSHKLGYGHDSRSTRRRPMSVGYSNNRVMDWCCYCNSQYDCGVNEQLPETKPVSNKKLVCYRPWYYLWIKKVCN